MRPGKKFYLYIIFAIALIFVARFVITSRHAKIVKGQTVIEKSSDWNYVIANYVNMTGIKMSVDGSPVNVTQEKIYMDDKRNIMVNYNILKDTISCASNRYYNTMFVLEKSANRLIFTAGSDTVSVNGTDEKMAVSVAMVDNDIYVPLRFICEKFNYDYKWNYEQNCIEISNKKSGEKIYPYCYDYRKDGKVTTVRNQEDFGTCWAFASLTALSSTLLPEHRFEFSADHMSFHNGYNLGQMDGGEYTMSMAYLAAWKGPVLEVEDPYGDGYSPDNLKAAVHVQEMQIIGSKDYNAIKEAVFLYGGVQSSLYMSVNDAGGKKSQYYNPESSAYCYIGMEKPNHDIVIVGWDDSYPADNFATKPEQDGAFICVNSWGDKFGENGYFYVSYFDSNIGIRNIVYTVVEDRNNYDNIYQSDELGWTGKIGYNQDSAYFANVYTTNKDEILKSVGFYAIGEDTEYEVYFIEDFQGTESFNTKRLAAKGLLKNAGYYTIKLNDDLIMKKDIKYAVVVYIKTPNSVHPVAVECKTDVTTDVVIDDGEGYISANGRSWERVEETQNCNICLKFYTDDME